MNIVEAKEKATEVKLNYLRLLLKFLEDDREVKEDGTDKRAIRIDIGSGKI
jgi:hypothetical protein